MKMTALTAFAAMSLSACVTEDPNEPEKILREDREREIEEALEGVDTSELSVLE